MGRSDLPLGATWIRHVACLIALLLFPFAICATAFGSSTELSWLSLIASSWIFRMGFFASVTGKVPESAFLIAMDTLRFRLVEGRRKIGPG